MFAFFCASADLGSLIVSVFTTTLKPENISRMHTLNTPMRKMVSSCLCVVYLPVGFTALMIGKEAMNKLNYTKFGKRHWHVVMLISL